MCRETVIEQHLIKQALVLGGECIKVGHSGWPDRLVTLPGGRMGWVEVKQPKGKRAKLQQARIKRLRTLGCYAGFCETRQEVDDFLEGMRWI